MSLMVTQDIVTRGAKFLFLYKRPGKRVIVNDLGRLMVSPTSMEASIQQSTAGQPFFCYSLIPAINQSTQIFNSIDESINPSIHRSVTQPTNQSVNQSTLSVSETHQGSQQTTTETNVYPALHVTHLHIANSCGGM